MEVGWRIAPTGFLRDIGLVKAFLPSVKHSQICTGHYPHCHSQKVERRTSFDASDILLQVTTFSQMVFSNMTRMSALKPTISISSLLHP